MIEISVDGEVIITITNDLIKMMQYTYPKLRVKRVLIESILNMVNQQLDQGKRNLQDDWLPKIRARLNSMPTKDPDIGALIYSQPDYKDFDDRNI